MGTLSSSLRFILILAAASGGTLQAAPDSDKTLFTADSFSTKEAARSAGWEQYSQRPEISPIFHVAEQPSLGQAGSLGIRGASNGSADGCWRFTVVGIEEGRHYRFEASCFLRDVPNPAYQVLPRLEWLDSGNGRVDQPEFVPEIGTDGDWRRVGGLFRAPDGAASVRIELGLRFCPQGSVWWDAISLSEVPAPPKRMVRVATVNCRPEDNSEPMQSVDEFCRIAAQAGVDGCDIVCLGEGINLVGVRGIIYPDIAEPIPGPTTEKLGIVAREHGMYIVAALGEREGQAVYNTAVLIDRQGRLVGKYRKVYVPREEIERGVTPGNSFPVFDTDFGRIGMMICWDLQYASAAQALAAQGAEIILCPIWGGHPDLVKARAIENHLHLVLCGYDIASTIHDPWGKLLVEAVKRPGVAFVDIDLNQPQPDPWLGNMRHRFYRELRLDIPVPGR